MGDQDQVTAVGLGKTRPCSIVTGIVYRKERKLPVRAANGYRKALIAHAVFSRDLGKFARGIAGPVQPLPVHRMEPLIAALNNRIDAQIGFIQIFLPPRVRIGAAAVLVTSGINPMIDQMRNTIVGAQRLDDALHPFKTVRLLQGGQQGLEIV